jgi:hypothetical protein
MGTLLICVNARNAAGAYASREPWRFRREVAGAGDQEMPALERRNPLLPWFIGLAVIAVVDGYVGYWFYSSNCQAPGLAQLLVLVAMPAVYLVLMLLTFTSQA